LGVGRDTARIVVGSAGDYSGTQSSDAAKEFRYQNEALRRCGWRGG